MLGRKNIKTGVMDFTPVWSYWVSMITDRLSSEIAMTVSAMDSFEETQANLSQRGFFWLIAD
jgi:hypothetical protein